MRAPGIRIPGAVGSAVAAGERPLTALAIVVGIAVLREGSEVVLFLYGVSAAGGTTIAGMLSGGALGIAIGAARCLRAACPRDSVGAPVCMIEPRPIRMRPWTLSCSPI